MTLLICSSVPEMPTIRWERKHGAFPVHMTIYLG